MKDRTNKHVLATGGAGSIGSLLRTWPTNAGHHAVSGDSYFTRRRSDPEHLLSDARVVLIRNNRGSAFYDEMDQISNLACPVSPVHYQFDPVPTTNTSVHAAWAPEISVDDGLAPTAPYFIDYLRRHKT